MTGVRANGGGGVIGTEHEPAKAAAARAAFAEAGLSEFIDLREGDLEFVVKVQARSCASPFRAAGANVRRTPGSTERGTP
jgi:predicted O-methyltransferase YrrM